MDDPLTPRNSFNPRGIMRNTTRRSLLSVPLVGTLLVLLAGPQVARAQDAPATSRSASAAHPAKAAARQRTADQPQPADQGGSHEGIKIHGHWTIQIKDPDGTVVATRKFENRLTSTGAQALSDSLSAGNWTISFGGQGTTVVNGGYLCTPGACVIGESGSAIIQNGASSNLQITTGTGTITLSGSKSVDSSGSVGFVNTFLGRCSPSITPTNCDVDVNSPFTAKTLSSPISVTAGQIVSVNVILSFS